MVHLVTVVVDDITFLIEQQLSRSSKCASGDNLGRVLRHHSAHAL